MIGGLCDHCIPLRLKENFHDTVVELAHIQQERKEEDLLEDYVIITYLRIKENFHNTVVQLAMPDEFECYTVRKQYI